VYVLITVAAVIPLYNGAEFIEEAIRSVAAQTDPVDEIIVVNDGSTDNGPEIVRSLLNSYPITLLEQPNAGQSAARNAAINLTSCTHVAFLDQDDIWYHDHVSTLKKPFLKDNTPNLAFVYGNLNQIDRAGRMILHRCLDIIPTTHPKTSLRQCLERDLFILPSASLVSKGAIKAVGMFDERLSGYEDDDLFTRLFSAAYDSVYLNRPVTKWRIYGSSTSFTPRMAQSRMIYFQKQLELYPDDPGIGMNWSRQVIGPRFMKLVYNDFVQATRFDDVAKIEGAWADVETVGGVIKESKRRRLRFLSPIVRFLYQNGLRRRARQVSQFAKL
jgi:glycosyltransferase involved in cell wall biosynthesis